MSGLPGGSVVKNLPFSAGDSSSNPGLGRSLGEGNGNPLQYSILAWEIPWREEQWATFHGVTKDLNWLSDETTKKLLHENILFTFIHVNIDLNYRGILKYVSLLKIYMSILIHLRRNNWFPFAPGYLNSYLQEWWGRANPPSYYCSSWFSHVSCRAVYFMSL